MVLSACLYINYLHAKEKSYILVRTVYALGWGDLFVASTHVKPVTAAEQ